MPVHEVIMITSIVAAFVGAISYQVGNFIGWKEGFKEAKRIWSGDYHG